MGLDGNLSRDTCVILSGDEDGLESSVICGLDLVKELTENGAYMSAHDAIKAKKGRPECESSYQCQNVLHLTF